MKFYEKTGVKIGLWDVEVQGECILKGMMQEDRKTVLWL